MYNSAIIMPSYQPSPKMVQVVDELYSYFSHIIVVDDGSGEEYKNIYDEIQDKIILLKHAVNQGKGRALKTAFNFCLNNMDLFDDGVITVDADGQHSCEDVLKIAENLRDVKKIFLGGRNFGDKNIPLRSRLGNIVSSKIYKWAIGIDLHDTQTGLRGLPKNFLYKACAVEGERYEYETNMLIAAKEKGYKFEEISIKTIYEDNNSSSHFNPIKDSIKIYLIIIKYCLSSFFTVIIDYIAFGILVSIGTNVFAATYIARVCAGIINFWVNRNLVFRSAYSSILLQLIKYVVLVGCSGTILALSITLLKEIIGLPYLLSKALIETFLFFINYYVQSRFVFGISREENDVISEGK